MATALAGAVHSREGPVSPGGAAATPTACLCPSRPGSLLISGQQLRGKAGQDRSINGPGYCCGKSAGPRAERFQAKLCAVRETDVSLGRACLMLHRDPGRAGRTSLLTALSAQMDQWARPRLGPFVR